MGRDYVLNKNTISKQLSKEHRNFLLITFFRIWREQTHSVMIVKLTGRVRAEELVREVNIPDQP